MLNPAVGQVQHFVTGDLGHQLAMCWIAWNRLGH
jgi:hypothetical protein